jgi:hypothetical protein
MPKPLRLLKFDSCHPLFYLHCRQQAEAEQINQLDYEQYYDWLMRLRFGLSDYLTHPMNQAGWEAREYIPWDDVLLRKAVDAGLMGGVDDWPFWKPMSRHVARLTLRDMVGGKWAAGWKQERKNWLIERYIETFRPDVIFVREPCHLDGRFWNRFRDRCVIASFIACNTSDAKHWDAHRNDLIFTLTPEYKNFFAVQGLETHLLEYGVDDRIAGEVAGLPKTHDCTFVGYLGTGAQSRKSELMDAVAGAVDFKWWGVKGQEIERYPALFRTWQGEAAGIDMLRIYKQSRIVLNDYVDMAAGNSVNMRTKEVMSVGSLLLTRRAANIEALEREGALATFGDAEECLAKIRHYLAREAECEAIGAKGLQAALRNFNYREIAAGLMEVLRNKVEQCGRSWY